MTVAAAATAKKNFEQLELTRWSQWVNRTVNRQKSFELKFTQGNHDDKRVISSARKGGLEPDTSILVSNLDSLELHSGKVKL